MTQYKFINHTNRQTATTDAHSKEILQSDQVRQQSDLRRNGSGGESKAVEIAKKRKQANK